MAKIKPITPLIALAVIGALASSSQAEQLRIPIGSQGGAHVDIQRPQLGWNKAKVTATFGEPERRQGPVGNPPISQWHYQNFIVYFEGDIVLHSVLKHQPKAEANIEQ